MPAIEVAIPPQYQPDGSGVYLHGTYTCEQLLKIAFDARLKAKPPVGTIGEGGKITMHEATPTNCGDG